MDSYKKLRAENDARYRQMSELIEKANQAGGDLSADDTKTFDSLDAEYRRVQGVIEKNHQLMALAAKDRETGFVDVGPDAPEMRRAPAARETAQRAPRFGDFRCSDEYETAYSTYLKRGEHTPVAEMRALAEGTAGSGDVLPPTEFHNTLSKKLQTMVALRKIATVMPLGSWKREIAMENSLGSAGFPGEGTAPANEVGLTYNNVVLQPKRLVGLQKVSNELIEDAPARGPGFSIESIITEQFARLFAQSEENAFFNGDTNGPAGILNDASLTSSTAGATAVTVAQIIDWIYALPRQYRERSTTAIVMSDSAAKAIRSLASIASGTVNYFWQNAGALGEPPTLMGIPVYTSAAMPAFGTTTNKFAIIGDWSYCVIGERSGYTLKVLRERYADANQTGYLAQTRVDCRLLQAASAFKVLAHA
jgi:HK97 family phage major capsid protein